MQEICQPKFLQISYISVLSAKKVKIFVPGVYDSEQLPHAIKEL